MKKILHYFSIIYSVILTILLMAVLCYPSTKLTESDTITLNTSSIMKEENSLTIYTNHGVSNQIETNALYMSATNSVIGKYVIDSEEYSLAIRANNGSIIFLDKECQDFRCLNEVRPGYGADLNGTALTCIAVETGEIIDGDICINHTPIDQLYPNSYLCCTHSDDYNHMIITVWTFADNVNISCK